MGTVRWGILSTADIGTKKVIPAIQRADRCEVVAIASRGADRAAAAATSLGIATSHGSYDALIADPHVDAIYNPLPNDLHAEWTIEAAAAGKHVLCEKPLALDVAQATEMVEACRAAGVVLVEAFMYRHHPSWVEAVRRVRAGSIGELQAVQSWFSYHNDDPANIRNRRENGGGALMDIGCYGVDLSRLLFQAEPVRVSASVRRDPVLEVDTLTSAILEFEGGGQATFACSTRSEPGQWVHILGTRGRIEVPIPFNIPPDRETRILVTSGGEPPVAPDTEVVTFAPADQYTIQAERFARTVLDGVELDVRDDDPVGNMRVIEQILAAHGPS